MRKKNVLPIIFTAKQIFLCLQHVENKGFQTVIKHRLKAIQKPIKNELGNREKKYRKCTFRFEKMHISFSRLYIELFLIYVHRSCMGNVSAMVEQISL